MDSIDVEERRARVGSRHWLAAGAPDVETVARDLVGLHSSDPATVYLSARARLPGFGNELLDDALYERRTLVRILAMRRTMFVVPVELAATTIPACTAPLVAVERKRLVRMLEDQQIADDGEAFIDRVGADVIAALGHRGQATAMELRDDVPELALTLKFGHGKTWQGEVGLSTRILFLLATDATIVRTRPLGTWLSSQYRWAPLDRWVAPLARRDGALAAAEVVARWLRTYGPGTITDLKWWTGWTVSKTRAALAAVGAVEVGLGETTGFVAPDDRSPREPERWAALLPGLDSTTMGWKERSWFLADHHATLFDRNGNAGPTIWLDGRVVGGWGQTPDGAVRTGLLEAVDSTGTDLIEERRAELETWLDGTQVKPRFPAALSKQLSAR